MTQRFECCGSPVHMGHLRNCKVIRRGGTAAPSVPMIDFANLLLRQLGYDVDEYDVGSKSYAEVSALINELKRERDG